MVAVLQILCVGGSTAFILFVTEFAKQKQLESVNTERLVLSKVRKLKPIWYNLIIVLFCFYEVLSASVTKQKATHCWMAFALFCVLTAVN
jgi:hypothetical protein